ncbi:hypothetical protein BH09PAT3_BH09PAT3_7090 [soil metagenome]
MGNKENANKATSVTSDGSPVISSEQSKPVSKNRLKLVGNHAKRTALVAVSLIVLVGLALVIAGLSDDKKDTNKSNTTDNSKLVTAEPDNRYQESFDNELKKAEEAVAKAGTPTTQAEKDVLAQKYVDLGTAIQNKGDYVKAVENYNKAIEISANSKRNALTGLFYAYAYNKQTDKAIAAGNELVALLRTMLPSDDVSIQLGIDKYSGDINLLKSGQSL